MESDREMWYNLKKQGRKKVIRIERTKKYVGPMCVLTMPLHTEPWQEHIIEKRFAVMEHLKNQLIRKELNKLKNLERTKAYRAIREEIQSSLEAKKATPDEKKQSELDKTIKVLNSKRAELLKKAGLTQNDFVMDMQSKRSPMQKHFETHFAAQVAHASAEDVWRAFEKVLFSDGDTVHFQKRGTLGSIACKTIGNGMDCKQGVFRWSAGGNDKNKRDLLIHVQTPRNDYEREMLKKPLKKLRIVRKWMKTRYKYYLQFTLLGEPVLKNHPRGEGRVGIDIGTRTIAICSDQRVILRELADRIEQNHRDIIELQRKMDRSKRVSNPDNFNPDGTVKRRTGGKRLKWVYSKRYKELAGRLRELQRKNADIRTYQHYCLANEIVAMGDQIYVEHMNFSGLQRRAKETKKDEKGRFQKKKRYGKSLSNKAPSKLLTILKAKVGSGYHEVDTKQFRASQFDHTSGVYTKADRSQRMKHLSNGDTVQRDMYSAFLLMNAAPGTMAKIKKGKKGITEKEIITHTDQARCSEGYDQFKALQDKEIQNILKSGVRRLQSFGF